MKSVCVIPARMASGRFPGKPLKPLLGLALVLHVYERCRLADGIDRIMIATCDEEIRAACEGHSAEVVMTADTHPGCVDRTEEAISKAAPELADDDLVLMVQGDEVLVSPVMLDNVLETYGNTHAEVVNVASKLYRTVDHDDPNAVKVIWAPDGRALAFSRSPIPSRSRAAEDGVPMYQQTGIIGFARGFLRTFGALSQTPLEKIEKIDMLRTLEHGYSVRIVATDQETIGVDTPNDLARAEGILRDDPWTSRYLAVL